MRADKAIELVREWRRFNYSPFLPSSIVIAETDWLAYVQAMAMTLPEENLSYPTEEDILWAWPDGILIVLAHPLEVDHTIVSKSDDMNRTIEKTTPHSESQEASGLCIIAKRMVQSQDEWDQEIGEVPAYPTLWIGTDPRDIVSGNWLPGVMMKPSTERISHSTRLVVSMLTALGHRLTRIAEPTGTRGERRRAEREIPGLRVLELASGASVKHNGNSSVDWSRRWMVRGHWRLQPHGPERSLRKPTWIDPYVKGPEDKPLDVRQTIWRTNA